MILVIGHARVREDALEQARSVALAHVRRSRTEPGCLHHAVHLDAEDPLHLVFVERWADAAALAVHFEVPASWAFVREITALCTEPPSIHLYDAEERSAPRIA
jgi:quinol monooxygenase YgiN